MADRLDVAQRLAEGRVAVEHTQTYVRACQAVGYQHPDLTAHPSRILEWFGSEEGLDLRALDRDCTELRAAGVAVAEALRMQRAQVAELTATWMGPSGDAAARVLQRHCDAANLVVTELRAAAQRCESLRDNLWYLVDSKVGTAIAVDDRAHQQEWLPAAVAVTTGVGQSAEEVVRQQVIPYVDNDIRDDWLTVMRSTSDGVETSYGMVIDKMCAAPAVYFEPPGDLGFGCQPLQAAPVSAPTPASAPPPSPPPAAAEPLAPAVDPAPTLAPAAPLAPAAEWGTALGDAAGMPGGDLGGGSSGGGGGLLGLAGRIVDAMSDLIGSATDDLGDADEFEGDDPFDEDPFQAEDTTDDKPEEVEDVDDPEEGKPAAPPADPPAAPDVPQAPIEPPPPADAPAPVAAPVAAPAAEPAAGGSTPCEIAADQLPQAGQ